MYTSSIVKVALEYTDSYLSIIDTESSFDELEARCVKLCEAFDFEYKLQRKSVECPPHWSFYIIFECSPHMFQHYMNVLNAFAQEFQINIANAFYE